MARLLQNNENINTSRKEMRERACNMKRMIFGIIILAVLFIAFQSVSGQSGTCGTNVAYNITNDTITFSKGADAVDPVWGADCRTVIRNNNAIVRVAASMKITVTNAVNMFDWCNWLKSIDLANFIFVEITSTEGMFAICSGLEKLDLSMIDVSRVTSMQHMFYRCSLSQGLDTTGWNTSNFENMSGMF